MSKINRRDFLLSSAPLITVPALLSAFPNWTPGKSALPGSTTSQPVDALLQSSWRWCSQCYMLYYDGYAKKGVCPAGEGHFGGVGNSNYFVQAGTKFEDFAESPNYQGWWRFCNHCYVMFFHGYAQGWGMMNNDGPNGSNPNLGRCAAGKNHFSEQGYWFWMQHDVAENSTNQGGWRFCSKCYAIFWDANPEKGKCPASGGHSAQGFKFVLPHDLKTKRR